MPDINGSIELIPALKLKEDDTIFNALKLIGEQYGMIITIVDNHERLRGIASLGDLRKNILQGKSVNSKLSSMMNKEPICIKFSELKAATDVSQSILDNIHGRYGDISFLYAMLPVITDDNKISGLISLESLTSYLSCPKLKLKHRTVLIVGGAGYIGSVLTRELLANGWSVKVLDKLLYGEGSFKGLNQEEFVLNRGDAGNVDDIVRSAEGVDAVVYLAELVGDPACYIAPQSTLKTNYLAVTAMAHLCSHLNINRFIYTSSCSVYGASKDPNDILNEGSLAKPVSLYGRIKSLVEKSILSVCNMPNPLFTPTILRLATVFGNSYRPRFDLVVNTFVKNALQKNQIEVFGGDQWRPNIHVRDVADAIIKVLNAPAEKMRGQILNVGSNRLNYKVDHLADIAKEVFPSLKVIRKKSLVDQRNYRVDFSKIKELLGFEFKTGVKEGMLELKEAFDRNELGDLDDPCYSNFKRLQELKLV